LHGHTLLQGERRGHLLKFLIEIQRQGRNNEQPRPSGKQILEEFYEYCRFNYKLSVPMDVEGAGKKVASDLSRRLNDYYGCLESEAPDLVVIHIPVGRKGGGLCADPPMEDEIYSSFYRLQRRRGSDVTSRADNRKMAVHGLRGRWNFQPQR
jgi:hypothetical protein